MQHSILYLFNPNNFLKIRNKSNQTKNNVFSDLYNLKKLTKKKKKKKQISKIEKTNILIENPKTQNKNESNLNLPNKGMDGDEDCFIPKPTKLRKKKVLLLMSVLAIWRSKSSKGMDGDEDCFCCSLNGSDELCSLSLLIVMDNGFFWHLSNSASLYFFLYVPGLVAFLYFLCLHRIVTS